MTSISPDKVQEEASSPLPALLHRPRVQDREFHQQVYEDIRRNGSGDSGSGRSREDDDERENSHASPPKRHRHRQLGRAHPVHPASQQDNSKLSSASSTTRALDRFSGRGAGQWWKAALFIFVSHFVVAFALLFARWPCRCVLIATLVQAWLQLLGITAGYHRLWSHRAFEAALPVRVFLAIIGLQSFQGSIFWWAMRHRIHHRFTDTKNDPHDSTRGFFYSHMGWLFEAPPRFDKFGLIGSKDLLQDPVVIFQRKYLLVGYLIFGALLPALLGHWLAGDAWAGLLWIGFVARFLSWHCIWSINSVSHWIGEREFSLKSSAVHMPWLGIFQNGEGHHNYHHEFPSDFRHGVSVWAWDPTKWCILAWAKLGWAWNLRETPINQIAQSKTLVMEEKAKQMRATAKWGPVLQDLPIMSRLSFDEQCSRHRMPWIIIDGLVVDVSTFDDHPGGQQLLRAHYGVDATAAFHGGVTIHTEAATHLMHMYAIARVTEAAVAGAASGR